MNIPKEYAPVILFVHSRPEHTQRTIDALKINELAAETDLIVYSDAARGQRDFSQVNRVRLIVNAISGFRTVKVIERETNYGLANNIIEGVSEVCRKYGRVIVMEDDLVVSSYFLKYMNSALVRYESDDQIMQISGHMFPVSVRPANEAFFLPMAAYCVWGTWSRAWQHFDAKASQYEKLKGNAKLRRQFDLNGSYDYFEMLSQQRQGKNNSWAIRWYLSIFFRGGITLYPGVSYVNNIGFDGTGVHCGESGGEHMPLNKNEILIWPKTVGVCEEDSFEVYEYLRQKKESIWRRIAKGVMRRARTMGLSGL